MNYRISPLARVSEFIPLLARWHHEQWHHLNDRSYDLAARIKDYEQTAVSQTIPLMFVAHTEEQPLASARLVEHDMDNHPELTPWLASLYVAESYRHHGIATALIKTIETAARAEQFKRLYLYTEDSQSLYEKLSWRILATEVYHDADVCIMYKDL